MNSIGGYKKVTLFFADQVTVSVYDHSAALVASVTGLELPLSEGKASVSSPDRGDFTFGHAADLTLKASGVDSALFGQLRQVSSRGCVLKCEDFDGRVWLLGDGEYPLTGSVDEVHGTSHTDLHHFRVRLSAVCLHPMLAL